MSFISLPAIRIIVLTLLISAVGGAVANGIGLPGGWLMGGALCVAAAALLGAPVGMPDRVRDLAFLLIGMSMGTTVSEDSLALIATWPVSLAGLVLELALIIAITGWVLTRYFRLDPGTAYLSSFPGHLSFILGIAAAGVGNPRQIVVIQVVRIFMLTIIVPIGAAFLPVAVMQAGPSEPLLDLGHILALFMVCWAAGLIFVRLRIPAGMVLGAMVAGTTVRLAGLIPGDLPDLMVVGILILTGSLIGSRFVGLTRAEDVGAAKGGIVTTIITVAIAVVVAWGVAGLTGMPYGQVWLGLAPGGLESMGALGVALGYDTAFIAAHHVIRLLLLSFVIPAVVILVRRAEARAAPQPPGPSVP